MHAALIGFGAAAQFGHLPWYLEQRIVQLTAVVEQTSLGRTIARDFLPHIEIFSHLEEMLDTQKVTFVDIVTPPLAHSELVLTAATAGLHILCEKPFVINWNALQGIHSVRQKTGSIIAACHNWYFAPAICRALELIDSGLIGEPGKISFTVNRVKPAKGTKHWKPEWRQQTSEGGGIIADLGYHGIYLASRIFMQPAISAHAKSISIADLNNGAENSVVVLLDYGKGRQAELKLSWISDARETVIRVEGSKGLIIINNDILTLTGTRKEGLKESFEALTANSLHPAWTGRTLDWFLEIIQREEKEAAWQDIVWSVSALDAIYASMKLDRPVETPRCLLTSFSALR